MKKVIPKKKDAFLIFSIEPVEMDSSDFSCSLSPSFQSPSFQFPSFKSPSVSPSSSSTVRVEESLGVAGKNIYVGDVVMLDKKGLVVPYEWPEGQK